MLDESIHMVLKIIALSVIFNPFTLLCIACLIMLIIILIKSKK